MDFSMVRGSNRVSTQYLGKYIEHPHFISCPSFQNLRLGRGKIAQFLVRYMASEGLSTIVANKQVALSALGRNG
jgi:hypothetical protein